MEQDVKLYQIGVGFFYYTHAQVLLHSYSWTSSAFVCVHDCK